MVHVNLRLWPWIIAGVLQFNRFRVRVKGGASVPGSDPGRGKLEREGQFLVEKRILVFHEFYNAAVTKRLVRDLIVVEVS